MRAILRRSAKEGARGDNECSCAI